ncbi:precorrin-6y C5,15-methyltransferase (decarboxylating) subunit CbiE [Umezawaea sp. Da 62-37]|uniref:precorrin-6y C5,15-methyltransferase (decarboxylating) subunit CbiE n=1 Tax=Umezawaea sp. Da 62-37 TaxID=3075927 RepID=UPI0028F6D147|nr:precorrin-6y C5,15-methyltransferase (decarboxylating) subunit CbiE [Umezawaea sp. Da 62-37]WNV89142.1 precorrin-6y C5,15-methyltransferase (decarboxylating) subunit CbiE [Umezawaea sp. Da 62-37]
MIAVVVVGIGVDGWDGLSPTAKAEIEAAQVLMGNARQLEMVPGDFERITWPSPMLPALPGLFEANRHRRVCVLASGDPMFHGIGSTLVRMLGPDRVRVVPHPSSVSLACARLGWAVDDVEVISMVARPVELLHPVIHSGRRILVLGSTPASVADLLSERGYGESKLTVLERLGGPDERVHTDLSYVDPLHILAVECVGTKVLPRIPGLPDEAFEHDGQLTKREVRAISLAQLAPVPGQLLWDVGAGAGSIAIEWARVHPSCRAIAIEHHPDRAERINRNTKTLGVPGVHVVIGKAPEALTDLERPSAIFIGGGLTAPGLLAACWDALLPGGRLVTNAVTMESESVIAAWHPKLGGDLTRIAINRGSPVGTFTGWRPHMPVTTWAVTKEAE